MRTLLIALAMIATFAIAAASSVTTACDNAECPEQTCCSGSGTCCK